MWRKVSLKGVLVGAFVDVIGSSIFGAIIILYTIAQYQLGDLPPAEQFQAIQSVSLTDPILFSVNMIVGGVFTILGGYIAARIAKHDELLNGTLASFWCVVSVLMSIGRISPIWIAIGIILNPLLGLFGGYLWTRHVTR